MAARRALLGVSAAAAAAAGIGSAYVALGAPEQPLADAPWADVSSAPVSRRAHLEALRDGFEVLGALRVPPGQRPASQLLQEWEPAELQRHLQGGGAKAA